MIYPVDSVIHPLNNWGQENIRAVKTERIMFINIWRILFSLFSTFVLSTFSELNKKKYNVPFLLLENIYELVVRQWKLV